MGTGIGHILVGFDEKVFGIGNIAVPEAQHRKAGYLARSCGCDDVLILYLLRNDPLGAAYFIYGVYSVPQLCRLFKFEVFRRFVHLSQKLLLCGGSALLDKAQCAAYGFFIFIK